jgi:hypothetical protein
VIKKNNTETCSELIMDRSYNDLFGIVKVYWSYLIKELLISKEVRSTRRLIPRWGFTNGLPTSSLVLEENSGIGTKTMRHSDIGTRYIYEYLSNSIRNIFDSLIGSIRIDISTPTSFGQIINL